MLLKPGVDISHLKPPIRKKLNTLDQIVLKITNSEMVITETRCTGHMPSSLHYADLAIDIRLPPSNPGLLVNAIKEALGQDYDVILEKDHIHIEYDPKNP